MNESEATTLERIHAAAEKEFLEHGFQAASLRRIVKEAGVTTGAFYGYYASKAELYEALVGEVYTHMMTKFCEAQENLRACRRRNSRSRWEMCPGTVCRICSCMRISIGMPASCF